MDWKLELVVVPVSDVDRAKSVYFDQMEFGLEVDRSPDENFRVAQVTSPGLCPLFDLRDPDGNVWLVQESSASQHDLRALKRCE